MLIGRDAGAENAEQCKEDLCNDTYLLDACFSGAQQQLLLARKFVLGRSHPNNCKCLTSLWKDFVILE